MCFLAHIQAKWIQLAFLGNSTVVPELIILRLMAWHSLQWHDSSACGCRYTGYCAWRGVMQASENPAVAAQLREMYKELGKAIYFDIARDSHAVLYELPGERLNWLW